MTRFREFDKVDWEGILEEAVRARLQSEELLRADKVPERRRQGIRYGIGTSSLSTALLRYALGSEISAVQQALSQSAVNFLEVFRLRKPWMNGVDGSLRPHKGGHDYTLTNSKINLRAVCVSLSAGEFQIARQTSALAWDPPNAYYIDPRSQGCRPYDPALAKALMHLVSSTPSKSLPILRELEIPPQEIRAVETRLMLDAICRSDGDQFIDALQRILSWHEEVNHKHWLHEFESRVSKSMCLWATGLSVLAVTLNVVGVADLPENFFCPRDLVEGALNSGKVKD